MKLRPPTERTVRVESTLCELDSHARCPGWWPDRFAVVERPSGLACSCACHASSGWPAWNEWLLDRGMQN